MSTLDLSRVSREALEAWAALGIGELGPDPAPVLARIRAEAAPEAVTLAGAPALAVTGEPFTAAITTPPPRTRAERALYELECWCEFGGNEYVARAMRALREPEPTPAESPTIASELVLRTRLRALLERTAMPDPDLGAASHTERHWHSWRELADSLADIVYGEPAEPPAVAAADQRVIEAADMWHDSWPKRPDPGDLPEECWLYDAVAARRAAARGTEEKP